MRTTKKVSTFILLSMFLCCYGDKRGLNLNDLIASMNNNQNSNPDQQNTMKSTPEGFSTTSVKTQEFTDLPALISAMKNGGGENNANLDLNSLLANKGMQSNENAQQQNSHIDEGNNDNTKINANSNSVNLANLASLLGNKIPVSSFDRQQKSGHNGENSKMPTSLFSAPQKKDEDDGPPGLRIETDGDTSQTGHSHFTLQRSPDGGLMLVPVKEETGASRGLEMADLAKKAANDIGGVNRQQLQLTTLAQALYSPFPGDQNTLHLHLKGKDGKDGKPGPRGHSGAPGPVGPAGAKGPKGEQGTCAKEVMHQPYTCTTEKMESLKPRVDFLEKVCKKRGQDLRTKEDRVTPDNGPKPPGSLDLMPASCKDIYEKDRNAKSGPYKLHIEGKEYVTHCEFKRPEDAGGPNLEGGWTLVARIKGQNTDWSPVSENWVSNETISEKTAHDIKATTSMKNLGYTRLKSNVLLLCFTGPKSGCAPFTHGRNMPLAKLFLTQFGVVPDEQYTFATFMKSVGKSCDLSILRQSWCGLNLANVCDPKRSDPNVKPPQTTHIVRIGCIGDRTATCFPDDYAIGIGVTSCKDGFGCSNVDASKNMHYRCDYVYGAFSHTAYLYVL